VSDTIRSLVSMLAARTGPENGWVKDPIGHSMALKAVELLDAAQGFGHGDDREILVADPASGLGALSGDRPL
jgi:hypothetical protein